MPGPLPAELPSHMQLPMACIRALPALPSSALTLTLRGAERYLPGLSRRARVCFLSPSVVGFVVVVGVVVVVAVAVVVVAVVVVVVVAVVVVVLVVVVV